MADTLSAVETRQFARELKFLVPARELDRLSAWARLTLEPDAHGSGPSGDEYETTTLYFETRALDVFHRRGSFGRSKLRIRRYGASSTVFLERKLRTDGLLAKRRTTIPIAQLSRLAGDADPGWSGHWFHKRMARRGLGPGCQLSYRRIARSGWSDGSPIRLTIDTDLRVTPARTIAITDPAGTSMLDDQAILELKFRGEMPPLFQGLTRTFGLSPAAVSKYRLGVAVLDAAVTSSAGSFPSPLIATGGIQ